MEPFTVAATIFSIGSSLFGGRKKKKAAKAAAAEELRIAKDEARKIRKLAGETRSAATAAYAASGVRVDEGTPEVIEREITRESEEDALTVILDAERRASAIRKQGQAEMTASIIDAAGTALWAGSKFGKAGWSRGKSTSTAGSASTSPRSLVGPR